MRISTAVRSIPLVTLSFGALGGLFGATTALVASRAGMRSGAALSPPPFDFVVEDSHHLTEKILGIPIWDSVDSRRMRAFPLQDNSPSSPRVPPMLQWARGSPKCIAAKTGPGYPGPSMEGLPGSGERVWGRERRLAFPFRRQNTAGPRTPSTRERIGSSRRALGSPVTGG